ncbi:MAG: prepilin-type N-terminal cleavage/methylation domain-containing protein [Patescibacteria group bacterium]|jgi:prepilin-type N-terminal cleavage/methylation domain-containing protein|nr:prepilin-type N-terminal cleavage/methylation domain-containing protein [Patescibacteria group bacterium]
MFLSRFIKRNQHQDGLTMLELLVTISIIVLISTVILVLGDKSLRQTDFFSKKTQAVFLAKEGMEIITDQIIRDLIRSDIELDTGWSGTGYWNVDYKGNVDERSELDCHRKLRINSDDFYAIGGIDDQQTDFSRCVIVTAVDHLSELKIKMEVFFDSREGEGHEVNLYRIFYY